MQRKLAVFAVFSLFALMMVPAYANVSSVSLIKSFYTEEENIAFEGTETTGQQSVFVIIRDPSGEFQGMVSDPVSDPDGMFSTIPRPVDSYFRSVGIYNATAFTDEQKEEQGLTIQLEFDGTKVFLVEDVVLALRSISDKTVQEEKTLSFTAQLTEPIDDVEFSLEKNPPAGASINSKTGKFTWTPTKSQAPGNYVFDIVVIKGALEDRESIKITVTEKPEPVSQPTQPKPTQPEEPEPTQPKDEPLQIPASFVDKTKDPQYYVDRYNNEPNYKEWFDENYSEYDSIYQAVGLEEPVELAPFVDPNLDPQYYVDRYNNEPNYKEWFDENYSEYDSIYQAVGLEEPKEEPVPEPQIGECGEGTALVDGLCTPVKSNSEGGGCLIATAAYGSELAPQVQYLREIRDGKLMNTESGASFMTGFNQVYYSFSPYIADMERENPVFKEMVKIGITPMLSTLSIMSMADSEEEILGYGIGVILMNIGMYVAAPAIIIYKSRRLIRI